MPLPASGVISLFDIRAELKGLAQIALNDANVRALLNKPTGIISLYDAYGKSSALPKLATPVFSTITGGTKQVSFTWNAVANATGYDVTFNNVTTNQLGRTFTASSLSSNTTYNISVVAKAANYRSSDVSTGSATTLATQPTSVTASIISYDVGTAIFTASSSGGDPATAYFVEVYSNAAGTNYLKGVTSATNLPPISVTGTDKTTVYCKVKAQNNGGSVTSPIIACYLGKLPSTPAISFSNITTTSYAVTVTAPDATSYSLYDGGFTFIASNLNGIFNLLGRTAGTQYSHRAIAMNSGGSSGWSAAASVTTTALPAPSIPTLISSSITFSSFTITATATNAASYKLYDYTSGVQTLVSSNATGVFNITGKTASATYLYRALATNSAGVDSDLSQQLSVNTTARRLGNLSVVFSNIGSVTATATVSITNTDYAIATYWVYLYTNNTGAGTAVTSGNSTTGVISLTGLTQNTTYYAELSVAILGGGGFSEMASTKSFTTLRLAPTAVSATVSDQAAGSALVTLNTSGGTPSAYYLKLWVNGVNTSTTAPQASNLFRLTGTTNELRSYTAVASNGGGQAESARFSVYLGAAATIPTAVVSNQTTTSVKITLSANNALQYFLYDSNKNYLDTNFTGVFNRTNLQPGTPYTFYAVSYNAGGSSALSGPISATTATPTLATPAFTSAVGGVNQVSFTWTSVANATSYDVTFNGVTTNQTSTSFTKSSVSAGYYQCAVSAKASGYNNSSTTVSAVVTVTAPVLPGTVTLTTSNITSTTARITATTNSGSAPTNFHLFRNINGTNTFIRSAVNGIFDLYDMTPGATYGPYRSYAENAVGISAYWSNDVYVTNTAVFTPVSTTASGITNTNWYTYSYTAPVTRTYTFTATGFDTQISFDGFTTFTDTDSQPGNGEQVTKAMTAGQSVTVSVRAFGGVSGNLTFSIT
jgi:hypothetical protein